MGLFERLTHQNLGPTEESIAIHEFVAALGEINRGDKVLADLYAAFDITLAGEQAAMVTVTDSIASNQGTSLTLDEVDHLLLLAAAGFAGYDRNTVVARLGL